MPLSCHEIVDKTTFLHANQVHCASCQIPSSEDVSDSLERRTLKEIANELELQKELHQLLIPSVKELIQRRRRPR